MCIYYERRKREKGKVFFSRNMPIIIAIIFNNLPNVILQPDFLIVEKPFEFPHFQLRRTMRSSFSVFCNESIVRLSMRDTSYDE